MDFKPKKYKVSITEILRRDIIIEACCPEMAKQIAFDRWQKGEYVLSKDDFCSYDITVGDYEEKHKTD